MDAQDLAVAIDIGHLKARAFRETKTTGINRGETHAIDGDPHLVENAPDLVTAQDHGELLLTLRRRATSNTVHSRPSVC
jgi:hypothetical protein